MKRFKEKKPPPIPLKENNANPIKTQIHFFSRYFIHTYNLHGQKRKSSYPTFIYAINFILNIKDSVSKDDLYRSIKIKNENTEYTFLSYLIFYYTIKIWLRLPKNILLSVIRFSVRFISTIYLNEYDFW